MDAKSNARFARAHISKRDFEEARDYLQSLRDDYPDVVKRAILVAATVSYARPFTYNDPGADGQSTPSLAVRLARFLTPDEVALHKRLLALRHEAVAHSSYARKAARRVPIPAPGFMVKSKPYDILSEPIDVPSFIALCAKLANHCFDSMYALDKKLKSSEAEP